MKIDRIVVGPRAHSNAEETLRTMLRQYSTKTTEFVPMSAAHASHTYRNLFVPDVDNLPLEVVSPEARATRWMASIRHRVELVASIQIER